MTTVSGDGRRGAPWLMAALLTLLVGKSLRVLAYELPLSAFFWNEALLLRPVQHWLGIPWDVYALSTELEAFFVWSSKAWSSLLAVVAFVVGGIWLTGGSGSRVGKPATAFGRRVAILLWVAFLLLFLEHALLWLDHGRRLPELLEYMTQTTLPIVALLIVWGKDDISRLRGELLARWALAATFIGHGLLALGIYPQPGLWVDLAMNVLPLGQASLKGILHLAGVLDFVAALWFVTRWKGESGALIYAAIWGVITALMRLAGGFSMEFPVSSTMQWLPDALMRLCHGFVPVFLLLSNSRSRR